MSTATLTGRKVFAITAGFFGIIIGANGLMAYKAISTFPGLEVSNSYVASQTFDAERAAQDGLGWTVQAAAQGDVLTLGFLGAGGLPVKPQSLRAMIGRATEAQDDTIPGFIYAAGHYRAAVRLAPGKWVLRIEARAADGTAFRQRITLFVKG